MATGQAIREELVDWGLLLLMGTGVGTGATNYITDTTRLQNEMLPSTAFDGCYVRFTAGADNGAQVMVDYLDPVNGRLYITPSISEEPSGDTYEVWRKGIDPDDVDRARDKALTEVCSTWGLQPVSEIANSGYEDALSSSNWEMVTGGTGTAAIQALSFPYTFARNSLLVSNVDAASGYVESASLYVRPTRSFYLYIPVSARVGTSSIVVRDVTNSADISLSGTSSVTGRGWTALEVTGTIPSDCYEITVRLTNGTGATDVTEWGPCHFTWQEQNRISLPDRIVSRKDVGPIFAMANPSDVDNPTGWQRENLEEIFSVRVREQADSVQLVDFSGFNDYPYFYSERVFYSALSAGYQTAAQRLAGDAASTTCPMNYVVPALVKILAEQYITKQPWDVDFWKLTYLGAISKLAAAEDRFGPSSKPRQERSRRVSIPQLAV